MSCYSEFVAGILAFLLIQPNAYTAAGSSFRSESLVNYVCLPIYCNVLVLDIKLKANS